MVNKFNTDVSSGQMDMKVKSFDIIELEEYSEEEEEFSMDAECPI